ncbi:hypothetical protein D9757_004618 [Collybiopsis confluens]|uniref:Uncharacterized protein n=1 Tax=Collybiopsis confluens TaxID=2823264 RepID=A0A8H5HS97_9AGAR|nr:hypothetical protein D9757_004618 [Collybiopsis confluens]
MSRLPATRSESSSSRNWWPLSSKSSGKDLASSYDISGKDYSSKKADATKLNSLASAIGFKSKKHPSLAIQDPPVRIPPPSPVIPLSPSPSKYTNRTASKSVSSTRSRVDSIEPRTPLDPQRDTATHRHSLLTLSDADPFASRGIAVPHSPVDPNRLSVYSGNGVVPEYVTKAMEDAPVSRISYASSSLSSPYSDELAPFSPTSSIYVADNPKRVLSHKKSSGNVSLKSSRAPDNFAGTTKHNMSVTDSNRLSHPDLAPASRPPMRARGLTDTAASYHRTNFLQNERSALLPPASPRVIVRQPSTQRMGLPVSAPPNQRLPPPPASVEDEVVDPLRFSNSASSSSSTSFRSSRDGGIINQHYIPRQKLKESEVRPPLPVEDLTEQVYKARTLKKAVSQQSLTKTAFPSAASPLPPEHIPDKAPRKQRSFHNPRIPLPPMPLSLKHQSSGSAATSDGVESKRASVSSSNPSRKRLFSSSSMRRPSTSQEVIGDDDYRSVFSFEREKPSLVSSRAYLPTTKSSFWDEPYSDTLLGSPTAVSNIDYTPQQIMSPAEMLKVEADVQESLSSSRPRATLRISSTSTFTSDSNSTPPLRNTPQLLETPPPAIRSNSMSHRGVITARLPRPSSGTSPTPLSMNRGSTSPEFVSLSPPPRHRRPQPRLNTSSLTPDASLNALSPPLRSRAITREGSSEKVNRRSSLMRKPSFLDIDDDVIVTKALQPPVHEADSFLDLARESLDTVRSSDSEDERF